MKVSIITPSYNCKKYFKETFDSVLNQTFRDFEWIIVDDCSKDNSYEFIKELTANCDYIHVFKNRENLGAAMTRNVGIDIAKGKYIAFLDADDLWKPNKLEKQIAFMDDNNFVLSYSNYDVLKNGRLKPYCPTKSYETYSRLLKCSEIGCLTAIYNAEELGKIYMPIDTPKREDYALWLDITKTGVIAHKINESLAIYRISDNSVSSSKIKMLPYQYKVYRKHEKFNALKSHYYLFLCVINKIFRKY